jgi:hypothetical protein
VFAGRSDRSPDRGHVQALKRLANDVITALSLQNLIIPAGTQKIGTYEYKVNLNNSPDGLKVDSTHFTEEVNGMFASGEATLVKCDISARSRVALFIDGRFSTQ